MLRRIYHPSTWQELERMQREMNRLFNESLPGRGDFSPSYPAINLWSNEEQAVLTAELAGISPDDIDIRVVGDTITISGERKADEKLENMEIRRQERGFAKFTRTLQLPFHVEADSVSANFENGVLKVTLPRAEAEKPRKITVRKS
ncbi:MAG: Hsp20/alpha crystallin family protein [Anaerolineaceae bacterium]|nr:Hsp20/alpha crystallin family protein [Anaerolineaceae bacterium]